MGLFLLILPGWAAAQTSYLSYSTYLGGDGEDVIHAMAADSAGNIYVTGETTSSNFPVTAGAFQTKRGNSPGTIFGFEGQYLPNAFVVKLNPAGAVVWATLLGGSSTEAGLGIAVDAKGSAYVLGTSTSPNFPVTAGAYQTSAPASNRAFLTKLSPDGSALVYSTFIGGSMFEIGYSPGGFVEGPVTPAAIAVDASGNSYIGGNSNPAAIAATAGAYSNSGSAFVMKLDATGSKLVFATYLGGSGTADLVHAIALDANGNIYVAGSTESAAFPATAPFAHAGVGTNGNGGAFLVKLDGAGAHASYSAVLGGSQASAATGVAVDGQGNAYLAGFTNVTNFPTAHAFQGQSAGQTDAFVAKVDPTGTQLLYSSFLGGSGFEEIYGAAVDAAGRLYVTGQTSSVDFPVTVNALPRRFAGAPCLIPSPAPFGIPLMSVDCGDAFVAQIDANGALSYSTYISGSNNDAGNAIAVTAAGNLWVAGETRSSDFPVAGAAAADNRANATCVEAASPSSGESYPCADGFVASLAFGTATPPQLRVVNLGSLIDQPVSPADVVTIFGSSIGPSTATPLQVGSDGRLTTVLGGWEVFFDGVAAPLILAAPGQIAAIVPNAVAGKAHTVVGIQRQGALTPALVTILPVNATAPAILTLDPSGVGQAAAINPDGTVNSAANPAKVGSVISLYVTGAGATSDGDGGVAAAAKSGTAVQVVVGNPYVGASVLYAGPSPGTISAVTQINVLLPAGVSGQIPIYFLAGGLSSQSGVTVWAK